LASPEPSTRLLVNAVDPATDIVTATPLVPLTGITPADWPKDSILFRPVRNPNAVADALGAHLPLVAPIILNRIAQTGLPLNRAPALAPPQPGCVKDDRDVQRPPVAALPAGLPVGRPRFRAQIVGLWDGGASFFCGVYHPSGACVMRQLRTREDLPGKPRTFAFCPVCRYVIVDRFDPTKHAVIDRDYAPKYPEP
jgi:hypothetical protein